MKNTEVSLKEGANKRGNSSRLTQSFHFFLFEPFFSPVNALNESPRIQIISATVMDWRRGEASC